MICLRIELGALRGTGRVNHMYLLWRYSRLLDKAMS
jgi:hypothetical protein